MSVPEHLWRFPTRDAIDKLAARFDPPNTREMQDWEWEVADPDRIPEFLAAYDDPSLSGDERFVLAEMLLQSFEDSSPPLHGQPAWSAFLCLLETHIDRHLYSIWYWADLEEEVAEWRVSPDLRNLLRRHRARFEPCPRGAV